ncbi:hypothetical protein [Pseudomonas fulva]|uniref:hypothetical protein n=1 Tax=Pseudomonas fulva TaxID=47880 RepID=UPI0037F5265F
MNTEYKLSRLVEKMLRATNSGEVSWRIDNAPRPLTLATDNFIPLYLEARYKGNTVCLFELREKYWTDVDEFNWTTSIHFGIVIGDRLVSDYSEYSPMLRQLFDVAREKASNLDALLDDMLD